MTYAQVVTEIRRRAQGMPAGWEEAFAARHDVTPTFVQAMMRGQSPIFPSLVAELAEAVGLRLELVSRQPAPREVSTEHPTRGSLP